MQGAVKSGDGTEALTFKNVWSARLAEPLPLFLPFFLFFLLFLPPLLFLFFLFPPLFFLKD